MRTTKSLRNLRIFCPLLGAFPLLGSALLGEYSVYQVVPCCSSVFWRSVVCHVDSYEPVMSVAIGRENDRDFHIVVTLGPENCEAPLSSIELKGVSRETLASVTALAVSC